MRLMKTNEGELGQKGHGSSNKRMTKKSQKWPNNPPMTILKSEVLQKYAPERELSNSGNNHPEKMVQNKRTQLVEARNIKAPPKQRASIIGLHVVDTL